jgi:alkanesulfonate monooxygenase SsuD/methylene tetrahydromethanopterin reductase-like flavin-dependent oxidoreductase (luciferase family)
VLWGHCSDLGRDPSEIALSSHLRLDPDPDPPQVAARAHELFDAGVDVVLLAFTAQHDAATVERLGSVLAG